MRHTALEEWPSLGARTCGERARHGEHLHACMYGRVAKSRGADRLELMREAIKADEGGKHQLRTVSNHLRPCGEHL